MMRIDGQVTSITERENRIDTFQNDSSYSVFLLTTQVSQATEKTREKTTVFAFIYGLHSLGWWSRIDPDICRSRGHL